MGPNIVVSICEEVLVVTNGLGDFFRVAAGGDHGVAGGEGCLRDVGAHAAAGAGDEPDLLAGRVVGLLGGGVLVSHGMVLSFP
ncbi:hypothetical protein [Arthrobacter sp. Y81]|uniref:hypothetical protein n=1 Tax=Arthrobacter sp. Y81 TaxID=2058897 RepID=UPI002157857F|nr:hypothetical protein [Arthrobacter sp. Y81]